MLRSANQYGLVEGSGANATVHMTQIGNDVIAPSSFTDRQNALLSAFRTVEDFRLVEEFYKNKKLPEDEFFENTLVRQFHIPRERVRAFIETFTKNLNFLKAFKADDGEAAVQQTEVQETGTIQTSHVLQLQDEKKEEYFLILVSS